MREKKNVILFGSPRSGTTWVTNVIAESGLKVIFEPLHYKHGLGLQSRLPYEFMTADSTSVYEEKYINALNGRLENNWIIRQNPNADRFILKEIRANLMIDWILKHFDYIPVYIIRNPISVISSIKKQGWFDNVIKIDEIINIDPKLVSTLGKYSQYIDQAKTNIEIITTKWCIENKVPQIQGYFHKMHFLKYEDLITNPIKEFSSLLKNIGINKYDTFDKTINQLSSTSHKDSMQPNYNFVNSYKGFLTHQEIETIIRIVDKFDLQMYIQ